MKKILLSTGIVLFMAGSIALGGTGAFFSDTETSTGNNFTAGAVDLKIDNKSYVTDSNGILVPSLTTSWTLKDLTTNEKFFNFSDLKPGDFGEDTISLHVDTNDAYLCANVTLTSNNDNSCTEPELIDDFSCVAPGLGQGELAQNVNFIWWADDGDNVFETNEKVISSGPIGNLVLGQPIKVVLADSQNNIWTGSGGPVPGNTDKFIGKAWCFGTLALKPETQDNFGTVGPNQRPAGFTCDGSNLNNQTQTDSLTADISFDAVQARHNPNFLCNEVHCPIITTNILIPGAGFEGEGAVVVAPQQWDIFPSVAGGWIVEWRDSGPLTFGDQTRPTTANLEFHRGVLGNAYEGNQYVELDTDWYGPSNSGTGEPASVKIYQDIVTVPGKNYEIHYAFAPRPNTAASENNLEFRFGGAVVDTTGPTTGPSGPIVWTPKVFTVTATTTTTRIEFTDLGTANSEGTFLDDVRVYTESCLP
jgi:predicted ribosomally synthesized peptide with SipW-like signal peptide